MLDLKKLLTKMLQELKHAKLNTSEYISSPGNTVSFTQDANTGQISVSSQAIAITPNQISGTIPANKVNISVPTAGTAKPKAVGTSAAAGTATTWSKSDHVHNITGNTINSALGYTPYDSSNPDGFGKITEIASTSPIDGSGTTGTITLSHSTSGVTSGVYGSTVDQSPTFGSSVIVPNFNVNNTGHLTTASTSNIIIPSNTFTAATTAVEGNVGLVPATSTATTEKFNGTTGLSNYWLNANGNWRSIPYAGFSSSTQQWYSGLMDTRAYKSSYMTGYRGYYHYDNNEGFSLTGSYTFHNPSLTNETSSWILWRVTFLVTYKATTTNANNTIALTIASKQNNTTVENYTQYFTVYNGDDRIEKASTVALLEAGSQKTLTIEGNVYTNKETLIYKTRFIVQPVAWGV